MDHITDYNDLLKQYFGHNKLKVTQKKIIDILLNQKNDVVAVLTTGYGKSICYQLPYLITKKSVLVISPLIALINDQKNKLEEKGINVYVLNSTTMTSNKSKFNILENIYNGNSGIIITTPEFIIKNSDFLQNLKEKNTLSLICIDESHCISTYGNDFRESYAKLGIIRDFIDDVPILALTATATQKVRNDIVKVLCLRKPRIILGSFSRKNLYIEIRSRTSDLNKDIHTIINNYTDKKIIIYCKTIKDTQTVKKILENSGINCSVYHAGLKNDDRDIVQKKFTNGECKCIIATIAFGMGVDIPDIRCVLHLGCPKNIESYFQEIGRAGRDGKMSECYMLYTTRDFVMNRIFLKKITNETEYVYQNIQINKIEEFIRSSECRQKIILEHFGKTNPSPCNNCDNCKKKYTRLINNSKCIDNTTIDNTTIDNTTIDNTTIDNTTIDNTTIDNEIKLSYNDLICLRCIYELKKCHRMRFGSAMLIKILKGSSSKTITDWIKDFTYYGSLKSLTIQSIKNILAELKNNGMIFDTIIEKSFITVIECTSDGINYIENNKERQNTSSLIDYDIINTKNDNSIDNSTHKKYNKKYIYRKKKSVSKHVIHNK